MKNSAKANEQEIESFRDEFEKYQSKIQGLFGDGTFQFGDVMDTYIKITDRLKVAYPKPKVTASQLNEMDEHRMYSFKQLYHIINKSVRNSAMGDRVEILEEELKKVNLKLEEIQQNQSEYKAGQADIHVQIKD